MTDLSQVPPHFMSMEADKRSGANGMHSGDRFVYIIDGRHGRADEFLQDGDAFVTWDDGTHDTIKWNNMRPESSLLPATTPSAVAAPEVLYKSVHDIGGQFRYAYEDDPKRLAFTFARYKHAAKLLEGHGRVLEVGCSDGFFSRLVRQHVGSLTAIDIDGDAIAEALKNNSVKWPITFLKSSVFDLDNGTRRFDAAYLLDVLEHIPPSEEGRFLMRLRSLASVAVIGMPSLESQIHASKLSKAGHVNCKSGPDLKKTLKGYYGDVFIFSMHDEALGTGFMPMAQYLLALCVG